MWTIVQAKCEHFVVFKQPSVWLKIRGRNAGVGMGWFFMVFFGHSDVSEIDIDSHVCTTIVRRGTRGKNSFVQILWMLVEVSCRLLQMLVKVITTLLNN